jgi:hypothetical protein
MCIGSQHIRRHDGAGTPPKGTKEGNTMAREDKAGTLDGWERLATSMGANPAQFPNLETERAQLVQLLLLARELVLQQAAFTANKQDVAKRLDTLLTDGRKLATFLRVGVKQKLGNRSEKILEFGIQPLRTRSRKLKATSPPTQTFPPVPTNTK